MHIELTEIEQELVRLVARRRFEVSRERGLRDCKQGDMTNEEMDLEGFGAELAFCKLTNAYPDMNLDHTNQVDALTSDGRTWDVKATKHETGRLIAVKWKSSDKVDFFVLMIGTFPKYRCAGFLPSKELLIAQRETDMRGRIVYAAPQDELQRIEDLIGE